MEWTRGKKLLMRVCEKMSRNHSDVENIDCLSEKG